MTTLFDLSLRGKIRVTGSDRTEFLHRMLTKDIKSLAAGRNTYAAFLTAAGKVLADMHVFVFAESILLDVEPGLEKKLIPLLEKYIITDDVKLTDETGRMGHFCLVGPEAERIAGVILSPCIGEIPDARAKDLTRREILHFAQDDTEQKTFATTLLIPVERGEEFTKKILEVGKTFGLKPAGRETYEILRIEAGILRYGQDISEDVTLSETGLDAIAADENKGCYPGQEVVARTKTYGGLQRKMTGLEFEEGPLPASGDKIYAEETGGKRGLEIGWVTSACFSPSLAKGIGLGYVRKGFFEKPARVLIQSKQGPAGARTTSLPFV